MQPDYENLEIKLLADCTQHIPYLAQLWDEEIRSIWIPKNQRTCSKTDLLAHAHKDRLPLTLVALKNNKAVGMASLRQDDGLGAVRTPWLGSLIVAPGYRKHKIGEQLINEIKEKARIFGYKNLYLLAFDPSIHVWYAALGWQLIDYDEMYGHRLTVMRIGLFKF
jgi:predicted N-acetyltransferase YhbS